MQSRADGATCWHLDVMELLWLNAWIICCGICSHDLGAAITTPVFIRLAGLKVTALQ
ncbi:hypothetical protein [Serratia fonticola]|uniref:hypothetical protein n=1 Tax=Serratia fonticola TaxID=47917 RepID=UPI003BB5B59F